MPDDKAGETPESKGGSPQTSSDKATSSASKAELATLSVELVRNPSGETRGWIVHPTEKEQKRERSREIVSYAQLAVSILGFAAVIVALALNTAALEATTAQLSQGQYQSVYAQQLNLWSLAASGNDDERAKAILGPNATRATAAETYALDFYAYVHVQQAPLIDGKDRAVLALNEEVPPPEGIDQRTWEGWQSWSNSIASGFLSTPKLCYSLNANYSNEFRRVIDEAQVCPIPIPYKK